MMPFALTGEKKKIGQVLDCFRRLENNFVLLQQIELLFIKGLFAFLQMKYEFVYAGF